MLKLFKLTFGELISKQIWLDLLRSPILFLVIVLCLMGYVFGSELTLAILRWLIP